MRQPLSPLIITLDVFLSDILPLPLKSSLVKCKKAFGKPTLTPLLFQSQNRVKAVSKPLEANAISI